MKTIQLHIKEFSNVQLIESKLNTYSYGMRTLYQRLDETENDYFQDDFTSRFPLNDIEYRSLLSRTLALRNSFNANNEKKEERINDLKDTLENDNTLTKRKKYKIYNKIAFLEHSKSKNIVFGGKANLRAITRECNKKDRDEERLAKLRKKYHDNRNCPIFVVGEANQKGNRFFKLETLSSGKIKYAPSRKEVCYIEYSIPKNKLDDIKKVEELVKAKAIPVTVSCSREYLYITYDEELVNGLQFNRRLALKETKEEIANPLNFKTNKETADEIYGKHVRDRENRYKAGRIQNRCIAVDLNPTNIGYSVLDVNPEDGSVKVIKAGLYDFSLLAQKLGKSNDSDEQVKQNNKRKYELTLVIKQLFNIALHYQCSSFVMEKLTLSEDERKELGKEGCKEFRRKINNVWNLGLTRQCIERRCHEQRLWLVEVNPCYSSFIGNIQYGYVDATNASIEIGRRGMLKYKKDMFYPSMSNVDTHTMEAKFGIDDGYGTVTSWVEAYQLSKSLCEDGKDFSNRLRATLDDVPKGSYRVFRVKSYRSRVKCITFS